LPGALTSNQSCNIIYYMNRDSRFSDALHVLLHMAHQEGPATSEVLAKAMRTNPVVFRRTMAGLRDQGYVRSEKGHGGGWTLACDLSKVTMRDIYVALGRPGLFAIGNRSDATGCLVEKAVNAKLNQAFHEAERMLMSRFGEVTLSMLSAELKSGIKQRRDALDVEKIHGGSA
jgi:DNA-binding IscR family transcriptional regulator